MKKWCLVLCAVVLQLEIYAWGFYGHRKINEMAIYLLPPEMMVLFKPNVSFIIEHSVDPDKRRYAVTYEAARHYIDIDQYGKYPYPELPRNWSEAVKKYTEDSLNRHGIVAWWLPNLLTRLTKAFREKNQAKILKYATELGHYIGDAHVPLHATRNHNGQLTGQKGIHGFWESRLPELLAEPGVYSEGWDFFIGKARFISRPSEFSWARVLESAALADTVLRMERELSAKFPADQKYSFEWRNGTIIRQYSTQYSLAYNSMLKGMVEKRMREAIFAVASFWYTAWINAGQPSLLHLSNKNFSEEDLKEFELLDEAWNKRGLTDEH